MMTAKPLFLLISIAAIFCYVKAACEDNPQPYGPCTTPNNEGAQCVSLFSCPVLIKSIGSSDASTLEFVKKSLCGDCRDGDIKVCCGRLGSYLGLTNSSAHVSACPPATTQVVVPKPPNKTNVTRESHSDFVIRKLLPNRQYCGLQHTDDRFYNKSETALDEFPWLVEVKWYNSEDEHEYDERCNGVLISNQYVLTDYLCGFHATKVKLGQHVTGQSISCVDDPFIPECTEPTLTIKVEEKFLSGNNKFVLMRLDEKVSYTDYLRPICLPLDESVRAQKQEALTFSGWGAPDSKGITKKRLVYNIADVDECYKDNTVSAKVDLVCLTVHSNNTNQACNGDHGGPLMFSYMHQWFVQGLLLSVFEDEASDYCSNTHPVNGVAITSATIEWILNSVHA